jgi:hypothetical protein
MPSHCAEVVQDDPTICVASALETVTSLNGEELRGLYHYVDTSGVDP